MAKKKLPQTSLDKQARQSLIQSQQLALDANRQRLADMSRGTFGGRTLRVGGSGLLGYIIGKPKGDKFPKPPAAPRQTTSTKPRTSTKRTTNKGPRNTTTSRRTTTNGRITGKTQTPI